MPEQSSWFWRTDAPGSVFTVYATPCHGTEPWMREKKKPPPHECRMRSDKWEIKTHWVSKRSISYVSKEKGKRKKAANSPKATANCLHALLLGVHSAKEKNCTPPLHRQIPPFQHKFFSRTRRIGEYRFPEITETQSNDTRSTCSAYSSGSRRSFRCSWPRTEGCNTSSTNTCTAQPLGGPVAIAPSLLIVRFPDVSWVSRSGVCVRYRYSPRPKSDGDS